MPVTAPRKITLSPGQAALMASTAPICGCVGGVGSGKSFAGILKARAKIQAGLSGAIVAPDFPHFARSTWVTMEEWLPWAYCTNKDLNHPYTREQVLKFNVNGKEVKVWYGAMENVEAWTGMNLNWFFFDEIKREKSRYALDILLGRLRVGKWPQGFFATSPMGKAHWLYDLCVKESFPDDVIDAFRKLGYNGKILEWWHLRTEDNKDNLSPTYYAMLKGLYTGKMALQELEGEFVSMDGAVWEEFSDKEDEGNVTEAAEYISGVPVEWWVDDGFTKGHPRVILMAQVVPPYVNIFDEYVRENEYPEESVGRALLLPYDKPSVAYIDSSAAVLRSKLWDNDIDTVKATHDIEQGILKVGPFIKDGDGVRHLRIHPRCKNTIDGILNYVRDEETNKPARLGDDIADAIRYGLWRKDLVEIKEQARGARTMDSQEIARLNPVKTAKEREWDTMTEDERAIYRWTYQYR